MAAVFDNNNEFQITSIQCKNVAGVDIIHFDEAKHALRTERPLKLRTVRLPNDMIVTVQAGIPNVGQHKVAILYCAGLGSCVKDPALQAMKFLSQGTFGRDDNLLIISYWNAYDNDNRFNFGGPADVALLYHVFQYLMRRQPNLQKVILYGSCSGAKIILHFLSAYAEDPALSVVKGAVLDSPPLDLERSLSRYMTGLYTLTTWFYFRHYVNPRSNALQFRKFPKHVRLFWSVIQGDKLADYDDVRAMAIHLSQFSDHNSTLFVAAPYSVKHGCVAKLRTHCHHVNEFYQTL